MKPLALTAATVGWLRYKRRCPLVCCERTPFHNSFMLRPDALGVTRDRKVIEVEVKQTLSDFKANRKKRGIEWREKGWATEYPLQFYFAVPRALVESVRQLLLPGEGLLTLSEVESVWGHEAEVVVGATPDKRATKLSVLQIGRMIMHQSGTLHRALLALSRKAPTPTPSPEGAFSPNTPPRTAPDAAPNTAQNTLSA